jgi:hypothetical protein
MEVDRRFSHIGFGPILLKNSKVEQQQNIAKIPSQRIFGNRMPCRELKKPSGWKKD